MGDKLFAIPFRALELNADRKEFVLNVPRLCGAPHSRGYAEFRTMRSFVGRWL
jgi:hypothetical protein